jgi:eukaryotic-like serine/threonine-protein kinase
VTGGSHGREFSGTDRFRVVRQLGAGGMGVVYEVEDLLQNARVALKTLRHQDPVALQRFKREFRALQDLQHPNLVRLGELFEAEGTWFFTMELVEGADLLTHVHGENAREVAGAATTVAGAAMLQESIRVMAEAGTTRTAADFRPFIDPPYDEPRLRASFQQLALALHALHGSHKVHRDVKPSNVRVTAEGRVVLLDFGLVTELAADRLSTEGNVVGTAVYMAPEQAAAQAIGPEADWYSFGVVLYEALTAALPFVGPSLQVLMDKQRATPPPPRARVPAVSRDLDELCLALLQRDPEARPAGVEILRRLGANAPSGRAQTITSASQLTDNLPFVGREPELEALNASYREARDGRTVSVHLHGRSGMGKSALVSRFLDLLEAGAERPMILRGRCYERETARFKALDGVVDQLARTLQCLPTAERLELVPSNAALLLQLFPVLGGVDSLARAPRPRRQAHDPLEERRWMFSSLRELLALVAERHPLVVAIEDMQWADGDSLELLNHLLSPGSPPPPPLLLLLTSREKSFAVARDEGDAAWPSELRRIEVARLGPEEATALARALLAGAGDLDPAALATEAGGHPMFIAELVRHLTVAGKTRPEALSLDAAIVARARKLPADARRVLEILAVASVPLAPALLEQAAGLGPGELAREAALLRAAAFIRASGDREAKRLEPYHDRVREAVLGTLDEPARAAYHRLLAPLLEHEAGSDPERVAEHYLAGGEAVRAADLFERAARRAEEGYAFERAAALHRRQLELRPLSAGERSRVHRQVATALASAGQVRAAAEEYLRAVDGASAGEAIELRRRAGEHLLRSGHIQEGLAVLGDNLEAVGLHLPASRAAAAASFLWQRALLRLGGQRLRIRDLDQIAAGDLTRLDALWAAAQGMGWVDGIRAAPLFTRMLRTALAVGERERLVRALGAEMVFASFGGSRSARAVEGVRAALRRATEPLEGPYWQGFIVGLDGMVAQNQSRFAEAGALATEALHHLDAPGLDVHWERATALMFRISSHIFTGRYREILAEMDEALRDAECRRDRWQASLLRLMMAPYIAILQLDAERALDAAAEGIAPWRDWPFGFLHASWLFGEMNIHLHAARWHEARRLAIEQERALRSSGQLRVQVLRQTWTARQATFALHDYQERGSRGALARAAALAGRLAREETDYARTLSALVGAQVAAARGQTDDAVARARRAIELAVAGHFAPLQWAARWYCGTLVGGDEGAALIEEARAACAAQGVVDPLRWTATIGYTPFLLDPPRPR